MTSLTFVKKRENNFKQTASNGGEHEISFEAKFCLKSPCVQDQIRGKTSQALDTMQ